MKKLLFTIMALSSFVWAEAEEKFNGSRDLVSAGSEQIKSCSDCAMELKGALIKLNSLIKRGAYNEVLNEIIDLQKKGLYFIDNNLKSEGPLYLFENFIKQSTIISLLEAILNPIPRSIIRRPLCNVSCLLEFLKDNPKFLDKLNQIQSNFKYFRNYIILAINAMSFITDFTKIDQDKYEKLYASTDDQIDEFFSNQIKILEKNIHPKMKTFEKSKEELTKNIKDGLNKLTKL